MTPHPRSADDLPPGWGLVTGEAAAALEAQLARELPPGHALATAGPRAIAQRFDSDEAAFLLADGRLARVRLSWSEAPGPAASELEHALFASRPAWLEAEMRHAAGEPLEWTDELDLHAFAPRDAEALVRDFLDAWGERARQRGTPAQVRIVHGKGIGAMREMVHRVLATHHAVARFGLATDRAGWGATVVTIRP